METLMTVLGKTIYVYIGFLTWTYTLQGQGTPPSPIVARTDFLPHPPNNVTSPIYQEITNDHVSTSWHAGYAIQARFHELYLNGELVVVNQDRLNVVAWNSSGKYLDGIRSSMQRIVVDLDFWLSFV